MILEVRAGVRRWLAAHEPSDVRHRYPHGAGVHTVARRRGLDLRVWCHRAGPAPPQAGSARLRAVEEVEASRTRHGVMAHALGARQARMAPRVLDHVDPVSGRVVRHPRRRARPDVPHHENETAQSHAAGDAFAWYWVHNAWLTVSGEKMSKSLDNSALVDEVLTRWRPVAVRYYLGAAHYRSTLEFSHSSLDEATAAYERIEHFVRRASASVGDRVQRQNSPGRPGRVAMGISLTGPAGPVREHRHSTGVGAAVQDCSTSAKTIRTPPVASPKTLGKNAPASAVVTAALAAS